MSGVQLKNQVFTDEEFMEFVKKDDNTRYELINGEIYAMGSPLTWHQRVISYIFYQFQTYFKGKPCEAFLSPLDVHLDKNSKKNKNVYQPDIIVVCDKNKIKRDGIYGAPDMVVEITSPSTSRNDVLFKYNNYLQYGVKEYWIVNNETINQCFLKRGEYVLKLFSFDSVVGSRLFPDLQVDFSQFEGA